MKIDMNVKVVGMENVIGRIRAIMQNAEDGGTEGIMQVAREVYRKSQEQIPRETGTAAASGYITRVRTLAGPRVTVGYGGGKARVNPKTGQSAADYLLPLHERLDTFHPNGKAKFLEDPLNEAAATIAQVVADGVRGGVR